MHSLLAPCSYPLDQRLLMRVTYESDGNDTTLYLCLLFTQDQFYIACTSQHELANATVFVQCINCLACLFFFISVADVSHYIIFFIESFFIFAVFVIFLRFLVLGKNYKFPR